MSSPVSMFSDAQVQLQAEQQRNIAVGNEFQREKLDLCASDRIATWAGVFTDGHWVLAGASVITR